MHKILVVEDESHLQNLIRLLLEKAGYKPIVCFNGEDALIAAAEHSDIKLILLDIMMPGIDGLQVLKSLKSAISQKTIPVILLTALAQQEVVMKGIEGGAKDYIRKPFHPKEFLERIAKHIK